MQAVGHRVALDAAAQRHEAGIAIDEDGLESALEQVADPPVAAVEALGGHAVHLAHQAREVGVAGVQHQGVVVAPEAVGQQLGVEAVRGPDDDVEQGDPVFVVVEDRLAAVATRSDVAGGAGERDAQRAGQGGCWVVVSKRQDLTPGPWLMHHKIMTAMADHDAKHRLSGKVQIDDAYLGGERAGGKPGRGSENKVPFVAAVSLNEQGNPVYAKMTRVPGFTSQTIAKWARSSLPPGADVLSDGLGCFAAVTDAGCTHRVEVVGQRKPRDLPQFKWVNTVLGNLRTMLSGAYKAFKYTKYADH